MRDNGWRRITLEERLMAIKEFEQKKESMTARDRKIIKFVLYDNLSALAISRRNDPDIICYGSRAKGKQLSPSYILKVVYKHFPYLKKQIKDRTNDKRVQLIMIRKKQESRHIKQCAFCGNQELLEEHHMIPIIMGGTNEEQNLVFLCHDCHAKVSRYQKKLMKKTG